MSRHRELLAAVLAEHGMSASRVIGVIHDSGGAGPDGTIWGGEILAGGLGDLERVGLLFPVRMPGGEPAAREPWRMACAWLLAATGEDPPQLPPALATSVGRERWEGVAEMARTGVSSPLTTSTGKLLAAVEAIVGLDGAAGAGPGGGAKPPAGPEPPPYPMPLIEEGEAPLILDARASVRAALGDLGGGRPPGSIRARVVGAIAAGSARAVARVASRSGLDTAALAGDAFAERALLEATAERLRGAGLRVLTPRRS